MSKRKWYICTCLLFCMFMNFLSAGCTEVIERFWNEEEARPSELFLPVLEKTGAPVASSLDELLFFVRKSWMRKQGVERWELKDTKEEKRLLGELLPDLAVLGLLETVEPDRSSYDGALILGSTAFSVTERMESFSERWTSKQVTTPRLFLVCAERSLTSNEKEFLLERFQISEVAREGEMMEALAEQLLPFPCELVEIAMKKRGNRLSTFDTVIYWLEKYPDLQGHFLLVSNQPYGIYQVLAAANGAQRCRRGEEVHFDLLASRGGYETALAVHLDNLATILFQIQQILIGSP